MEENSNVANELREAVKKAFAEGKTASNFTELVVLPTKQVFAIIDENGHLREENRNLYKVNAEQKAEIERLKKFEMFRIKTIKDLNKQIDEFVKIARVSDTKKLIETIKEQAVKATAKEIIRWIKLNGILGYGGYVIHDSTIEQMCKKYGVEVE